MTTWTSSGFEEFYASLHPGRSAFQWQLRLITQILDTGHWPAVIDAPTGSGKTAVIDAHIFAVAAMAAGQTAAIPRRLSVVVDRRAIVDSHEGYARDIRTRLHDAEGDLGILGEVAAALGSLQSAGLAGRSPFGIAVLRGGAAPSRQWVDDPSECQVICATPDMWGSRLLFRPYGATAHSAPRAAGLLAYDSVLVVDEAHLSRQFTHATRSVAGQLTIAEQPLGVPPLQVVSMTATQSQASASRVGVDDTDLAQPSDAPLAQRMTRPKPLTLRPHAAWPAGKHTIGTVAETIAGEAIRLRDKSEGTVACVVNTVAMAVEVTSQLHAAIGGTHRTLPKPKRRGAVETLVGRMRGDDVQRLANRHPGLLTVDGDPDVGFLVATQTVEVGLDIDFAAMVTELAPGAALAQRVGRVNRLGARDTAHVVVIGPKTSGSAIKEAPPYQAEELAEALEWITDLSHETGGICPANVKASPPPPGRLRRPALMRVEPWDALTLANTSIPQFDEPDLELWLDDDLDADLDIEVVVRHGVSDDFAATAELLRATPPLRHEAFRVSVTSARDFLQDRSEHYGASPIPGAVIRTDELLPLAGDGRPCRMRPGDTLVLSDEEPAFRHAIFDPRAADSQPATDVYESIAARTPGEPVTAAGRRVRLGARFTTLGDAETTSADLARIISEATTPDDRDAVIVEYLQHRLTNAGHQREQQSDDDATQLLVALLEAPHPNRLDVIVAPADTDPVWIVLANTEKAAADEELRQTWSRSGRVLLADHSDAVRDRADHLAGLAGVAPERRADIALAGFYHDAGKSDPRFQTALGVDHPGTDQAPLAKSGMRSPTRKKQAWAASGLSGWRHEQMSAAIAAGRLPVHEQSVPASQPSDLELVIRLVGTSHGWGRPTFNDTARGLLPTEPARGAPETAAERLFDDGLWDDLVDSTHQRYGVWGCAYLEALVRAADGQVSGEGR